MFNQNSIKFLQQLKENNNRDWFHEHKADYEELIKNPAQKLTDELTQILEHKLSLNINAKVFRINRDVRFSKDKTPYNTHVRIAFFDANYITSGFYLSIEHDKLIVGAGIHSFDKEQLARYQQAIINDKSGSQLVQILDDTGGEFIDMDCYKKNPCKVADDFPRNELLRNKGLAVFNIEHSYSGVNWDNLTNQLCAKLELFYPLHNWITQNIKG